MPRETQSCVVLYGPKTAVAPPPLSTEVHGDGSSFSGLLGAVPRFRGRAPCKGRRAAHHRDRTTGSAHRAGLRLRRAALRGRPVVHRRWWPSRRGEKSRGAAAKRLHGTDWLFIAAAGAACVHLLVVGLTAERAPWESASRSSAPRRTADSTSVRLRLEACERPSGWPPAPEGAVASWERGVTAEAMSLPFWPPKRPAPVGSPASGATSRSGYLRGSETPSPCVTQSPWLARAPKDGCGTGVSTRPRRTKDTWRE
jgi:hypothetical protein